MSKNDISKHYLFLVDLVNQYDHAYHVLDAPLVSDDVYNQYFLELKQIETDHPELKVPYSPTQRVGGHVRTMQDVEHRRPMLSLDNAFNKDDLSAFIERVISKIPNHDRMYLGEVKLDGLAINLTYVNGVLHTGVTRGDGQRGDDVTTNVKTIRDIPLILRDVGTSTLEIRGEVYLPKDEFKRINEELKANGLKGYVNPRNAAAGILRQLDSAEVGKVKLRFCAYGFEGDDPVYGVTTQDTLMDWLERRGFVRPPLSELVEGLDGCLAYVARVQAERDKLPLEIDGAVLKVNDRELWDTLASTSKFPHYAIAYKFPPEEAISQIHSVTFQVGRTGSITPVANIVPVFVGGVTVSNVTLHNRDEIERLDVRIHDDVVVRRAGDVIPEITRVVTEARNDNKARVFIKFPDHCPACGTPLVSEEDVVRVRCPAGYKCPAQLKEGIVHFASRKAMDIDGLGDVVVERLIAKGILRSLPDIYALTVEKLLDAQMEGFGELSAVKLIKAIEGSKQPSLARFLYALGIREVGVSTAKNLAKHFGSIEALNEASIEELLQVKDVGAVGASFISSYFADIDNIRRINSFFVQGVQPASSVREVNVTNQFYGKTAVITGSFSGYTRDQIVDRLEELGATVSSSVSAKTDVVIVGAEAGSKLAKAQQLGIRIVTDLSELFLV